MSTFVAIGVLVFMLVGLGVVFALYRRVSSNSADALASVPAARLYWLAAILTTSALAVGGVLVIWVVWGVSVDVTGRLAHTAVVLALWLLTGLFVPFFIVFRASQGRLALPALVGAAVSLSLAAYLTQYPTYIAMFANIDEALPLLIGAIVFFGCLGLLVLVMRWLQRAEREIW